MAIKTVRYTRSQLEGLGTLCKDTINGQLRNTYEFDLTKRIDVKRDSDSLYFSQEADENFHEFMERKGREMNFHSADTFGHTSRSF